MGMDKNEALKNLIEIARMGLEWNDAEFGMVRTFDQMVADGDEYAVRVAEAAAVLA